MKAILSFTDSQGEVRSVEVETIPDINSIGMLKDLNDAYVLQRPLNLALRVLSKV